MHLSAQGRPFANMMQGSDHCPVYAILKDQIEMEGKIVHTLDAMNPPGMFQDGKRQREHSAKDILPTSGRLIPDFTGRQSIRDMFSKRPSLKPSSVSGTSMSDSSAGLNVVDASLDDKPGPSDQSARASAEVMVHNPAPSEAAESRPALKRSLPEKPSATRQTKKAKNSGVAHPSSPLKGQSQIVGFFKPKTLAATPTTGDP